MYITENAEFKIGINNIYDIIPLQEDVHLYCEEFEVVQKDLYKLVNLFKEFFKIITFRYYK